MDAPVYTAQVDSITRGWSYAETHGQPPAAGANTYLVDPLVIAGGFDDGVIPNQLEPHVATINLWSLNSKVRPLVRRGDLLVIRLRLGGPAGPTLFRMPMQVSEVTTELVPGQDYPYRATIRATDMLVTLGGYFPGPRTPATNSGVRSTANRLAWIGAVAGYSVGVPAGFVASVAGLGVYWLKDKSARELWRVVLNTMVPNGNKHHAVTPYYSGPVYPSGYAHPGTNVPPGDLVPDPGSALMWLLQPASRNLDYQPGAPLRFAKVNQRLEMAAPPAAWGSRMPAVPARACTIPASARQGREHAPNSVRLLGKAINLNGVPADPANLESESTLDVTSSDAGVSGYRGREVETLMTIREYGDDPATAGPPLAAAVALAQGYLADDSALARDWTFDDIVVNVNDLTPTEAASVLPVLIPAYLDGERDGRLIRHLTVYGIDPEVRLEADTSTIDGFVVAWRIELSGGQLTYVITTTPGRPNPAPAGPVLTLGEFTAGDYTAGLLARQIDPTITLADLDLID